MSAAYLKYYFAHDGSHLFFDSLVCVGKDEPEKPQHFLKWYEEGDFVPQTNNAAWMYCESPIFQAVFGPRAVTFPVDELLKQRG